MSGRAEAGAAKMSSFQFDRTELSASSGLF